MTIRSLLSTSWLGSSNTVGVTAWRSRHYLTVVGALSLIGLMVCGCATSGGKKYTYRNMPPELLAAKRENAQTLDLTRLARASANSDIIDVGDVLEVSIAAGLDEKDTIKMPVRINDEGIASLPEIGQIPLAGLEMEAAEAAIVAICVERQLYRNPSVTVTMKHQRMNRVLVVGAVEKPDVYELPRGQSDLLAAIVSAGGLHKDAGTQVEIRNPKRSRRSRPVPVAGGLAPEIDTVGHSSHQDHVSPGNLNLLEAGTGDELESIHVDLVSATKTGKGGGYLIADGGVVSVEKRDPEPLHVMGLVRKPDRYEFPIAEDVRVTDAIALAGGHSPAVADKIFVIRRKPRSSETVVIQLSLRAAKRDSAANLRLEPGDVVSVEQTPATAMMEVLNIMRFGIGASLPLTNLF